GLGVGAQQEDAAQPALVSSGSSVADALAAGDTADAAGARGLASYHADVPSAFGQAAALSPTMLLPGGPVVGALAQGATAGFLTPTQKPSWASVAGNTAAGAVLGGALGKVGGALAERTEAPSVLPPDVLERLQAMRAVGVDNPPLPALTRSPQDWYDYAELGKQEGPAKDAYIAANHGYQDAFGNALDKMRSGAPAGPPSGPARVTVSGGTPIPPTTPYAAAEGARQAVQGYAKQSQQAVGAMYDAARNAAGAGAEVPMQPVADQLGKTIEDCGAENIPAAVVSRAKEYGLLGGTQTRSFTVTDAKQFRKFLGNNLGPYGTPQFAAVRQLQNSVDEAVNGLAGQAGGDAGAAYQAARAAARARFATLEPTPIARLANTDEANPNFLPNLFTAGKPGEISAFNTLLQSQAPDAAAAVRSSLLDYLNDAATRSANGRFSAAGFGNALDRVGPDRLSAVFSPQDVAQLNNLRAASTALTVAPDLSGVNTSNTGSVLGNMLKKIPIGPMAGAALGGVVGHVADIPMVPEMIGAGLGGVFEHLAQNGAAARMRSMLNPDLAALATPTQGQMPAIASLLMQRGPLQRVLPLLAAPNY